MKQFILILIVFIVGACKNHHTGHTDKKEYGFEGDLKKVTTVNYSNIIFTNNEWEITDTSNWESKTVFEYNKEGNIESSIVTSLMQGAGLPDTISITKYADHNGNKNGVVYNADGTKTGTIKYEWTSKTSYILTAYDKSGKISYTAENQLNESFRNVSGIIKGFSGGDKPIYQSRYEYILDKNKRVVKLIQTDPETNEVKEIHFTYKKSDSHNNPGMVFSSNKKDEKPNQITLLSYDYY